ncbi:MAG: hypothetical protein ACYDCC_10840 [Actinomycetota bacterium]
MRSDFKITPATSDASFSTSATTTTNKLLTPTRVDNVATPTTLLTTASRAIESVVARIASGERRLGRERLVNIVNAINTDDANNHVAQYRHIIRAHRWPNTAQREVSAEDFINQFGRAALVYIDCAFEAAAWLERRDSRDLPRVHGLVLASEALRGQLGKSSPAGLDERLDRAMEELLRYLKDEDDLYILCSLPTPMKSAETQLVDGYATLRTEHETVPDITTLLSGSENSTAWTFFRTFCRWRLDRFAQVWIELEKTFTSFPSLRVPGSVGTDRAGLLQALPPRAQKLSDYIAALNLLNLALEPSFSFKGGPGLLHAEVFRAASHLGGSPMERQLVLEREQLLNAFPNFDERKEK